MVGPTAPGSFSATSEGRGQSQSTGTSASLQSKAPIHHFFSAWVSLQHSERSAGENSAIAGTSSVPFLATSDHDNKPSAAMTSVKRTSSQGPGCFSHATHSNCDPRNDPVRVPAAQCLWPKLTPANRNAVHLVGAPGLPSFQLAAVSFKGSPSLGGRLPRRASLGCVWQNHRGVRLPNSRLPVRFFLENGLRRAQRQHAWTPAGLSFPRPADRPHRPAWPPARSRSRCHPPPGETARAPNPPPPPAAAAPADTPAPGRIPWLPPPPTAPPSPPLRPPSPAQDCAPA